MAPPPRPRGTIIQFTNLNERVRAKCSRHPATTPRNTTLANGLREHYSGLPGNCRSSDTLVTLDECLGDLDQTALRG
jgi:hypothetical protein